MALLIINHFEAIFGSICLLLIFILLTVDTVMSSFLKKRIEVLKIQLEDRRRHCRRRRRRRARRINKDLAN